MCTFKSTFLVRILKKINVKFSQDTLKSSQLHRNRDFRDHFLRFRDIKDQVFKKGTLGDLRDQVAALSIVNKTVPVTNYLLSDRNANKNAQSIDLRIYY